MNYREGPIGSEHAALITALPIDHLPVPVVIVALDGRMVRGNDAFCELFGCDHHQLVGLPARAIGDHLDTSWPDHHLAQVRAGVVSGQSVHHRFRRVDGGQLTANLRTWPAYDDEGAVVAMCATFTAATQADANQYRLLWQSLEHQYELMCEWALDGTVLFCNRACRDFFGWPETVVGRKLDEVYAWDESTSRVTLVGGLMAGLHVERQQRTYDDGRVVEWADTPVRDALGNVRSILSMGRDVTQRLATEEALRLSERRYRALVNNVQDAVVLLDREGRQLDNVTVARPSLGYPVDNVMGNEVLPLVHPDDRPVVDAAFVDLLGRPGGSAGWFEVRVRRFDGSYSWLEVAASNQLDDPVVGAVVLTVRNIDERKRMELELDDRRQQAQEELRQRLALVAQVGHELRNPLQGIAAFSDVLAAQALAPTASDASAGIVRLTGTLRRVVDDLLDASQLDLGTLRVASRDVDLAPIIDEAVLLGRQLAHPGVTVSGSVDVEAARYALGDDDRIRQALANLVSNACKHTTSGYIEVVCTLGAVEGSARISVLDTGIGISADDVARLFKPFERGVQASPDTPGIGLGLAIVTGIARAMGGSAGATPRSGGGSVFWLEIPLGEPVVAAAAPPAAPAERPVPFRRVLVVDDEPLNRMAAKFLLADLGAEVVAVPSAEQALQLMETDDFDVLLLDVRLSGMSGLELTGRVRAGTGPQPVIAVMTGDVSAESLAAADRAGADVFIAKPSNLDDLVALLQLERAG
ncbi:MAG: hypothetical protein RL238_3229 [Actinomycetota bacterium]